MTLILSGTDGLSDVDGTAATPALRGTDANTGIFFPAADTIAFSEGGAEVVRINSSGDVGIGTSSPVGKLDVITGVNGAVKLCAKLSGGWSTGEYVDLDFSQQGTTARTKLRSTARDSSANNFATALGFYTTNASNTTIEVARIDYNGQQSSVILDGSTLYNEYKCRAWVAFTGTGTPAIRGSGNVSSITDLGTGDYRINYTTAMPDVNYCYVTGVSSGNSNAMGGYDTPSIAVGSLRVYVYRTDTNVAEDASTVNVAIFR